MKYHNNNLTDVENVGAPITFVDAVRQLEAYDRLNEVDHLVQSICTSAGTRQGSTVVGTVKIEYYWQLLIYYLKCRFNF